MQLPRVICLFVAILLGVVVVHAKALNVSGIVTDESGQAVIGATVVVKESPQIGTVTDFTGAFNIFLPNENTTLVVSYIGFATQEVAVGTRTSVEITMATDTQQIDEVIVVGYGQQKKVSSVGSIASTKGDELLKTGGVSSVSAALQGQMPGVVSVSASSKPGEDTADIFIRGKSSTDDNTPLYLVDGVERSIDDIDMNEVESVSVLKDASATAVYGVKGANGVIIVTTKRGRIGAPKLSASVSCGLSMPSLDIPYIDGYTTMSMRNEGLMASGNYTELLEQSQLLKYGNPESVLDEVMYPDVDWVDLLTKDFANETNANFTLSGGTEKVVYFVSLGYTHESSLFKTYSTDEIDTSFKNDRINYRTNFDFNLGENSKLRFNVGGNVNINNQPTASIGSSGSYLWDAIYTQSSTKYPAYYTAELLEAYPDLNYPDDSGDRLIYGPDVRDSPYSYLNQGQFEQMTTATLYTDLAYEQKLDFITKGLSASAKVSVNTSYKRQSLVAGQQFPQYTFDASLTGEGENPWTMIGDASTNLGDDIYEQEPLNVEVGSLQSYSLNLYYEASLNYNRSFSDHHVSGLFLFNRTRKQTGVDFPYFNESWVGRATYDYKHKYLAEVNIGYTGSEKFAPSNRFGLFPSFAVGYTISNEKWFQDNVRWIDKLKLRYSDGRVGSDSGDRWLYVSEYLTTYSRLYEGAIANLDAQWEESHKRDFGIEFGFLKNALTFHVDLFDEYRTNMLVDPSNLVSDIMGGNGFKEQNLGEMKKHGMEVEAEYRGRTKFGLQYAVRGMYSFNENRIIAKGDIYSLEDYQKEAGKAYGGKLSGTVTTGSGYYTSIDDIHNYTTIDNISLSDLAPGSYRYVDYNADGSINSTYDTYPIEGSQYPPVTYSFGGELSYKNFSLNVLFQGTSGKYVSLSGAFIQEFPTSGADWRVQSNMLDYWTPTNQDATFHSLNAYTSSSDILSGTADRAWIKADYLKIRDIYFGYMFDTKSIKEKIGLSSLTLYVTGNNLFTFSDFVFGDPESTTFSTGGYPQMKTVKFGVKLGF